MNGENRTMTEGPIASQIIKFAIPLILTGILQQLYNTVDSIIIGNFCSSLALAGVGGVGSLISLVINIFIGLSLGTNIVVAQLYGAGAKEPIKKAVHTSVAVALISGVITTIAGVVAVKPLLNLIAMPQEVMPYSEKYTTIYFMGILPSILYNFLASILRAVGDSKRPLIYLIVSAVLNVVLNIFFITVLGMDVDGVAIATVISQIVACVLALIRLTRVDAAYKIVIKEIRIYKTYLINILRLGIPSGINSCLFAISNLLIQASINTFGAAAVAGCAADTSIENFVWIAMNAIGNAAATYIGQNLGAGKFDRIKKGFRFLIGLVTGVGLVLGISVFIFGTPLLRLFTDDTEVIACGLERMSIVAVTYFTCGIMDVLNSSMRGLGDSIRPMIISVFGVCGTRILWILAILPFNNTITMLYYCYPISWVLTAVVLYILYRKEVNALQMKIKVAV